MFNFIQNQTLNDAIEVAQSESTLEGDLDSEARVITKQEIKDYPVIYEGVKSDEPILVTNTGGRDSEVCVVDNDKVLRCFNNINLG